MRKCNCYARRLLTLGLVTGVFGGCSVYDESLLTSSAGAGGMLSDSGTAGQDTGGGGSTGSSGAAGETAGGGATGGSGGNGTSGNGGAAAGGAGGEGGTAGAAGAAGDLIVILTNRNALPGGASPGVRYYIALGTTQYLEWTAATLTTAEVFERVTISGDQIKLRAQSTGKFVALDTTNDELIANADESGAATLNTALCATTNNLAAPCAPNCRGIEVVADDDNAKWVASDDAPASNPRGMHARSTSCGGSVTSWESFEFQAASQ